MRPPPDWLVYSAAVAGLIVLAVVRQGREHADAPAAPPPLPAAAAMLSLTSPMPASLVRQLPRANEREVGTAFSVSDAGVWLTARHVVGDCRRAAVLVSPGRGVIAKVIADRSGDVAVLTTEGGAPPLPLADEQPKRPGLRAYHPGFPAGQPGEAASRLIGPYRLHGSLRGEPDQPVLAWTEVGRTKGLKGSLAGLSGAPVLDNRGRVIGVTLAESPRRGRIYTAPPEAIRAALAYARQSPAGFAQGQSISTGNYGRAADGLRRDLRVAPVACLD
jgi:serine protease Do